MKAINLRRRPDVIRYFYLAVGEAALYTGMSWRNLSDARDKEEKLHLLLGDVVTRHIIEITDIDTFLQLWKQHYNDPAWEYSPAKKEDLSDDSGIVL